MSSVELFFDERVSEIWKECKNSKPLQRRISHEPTKTEGARGSKLKTELSGTYWAARLPGEEGVDTPLHTIFGRLALDCVEAKFCK